eukprot:2671749-Prymnesium_polylepis.1
MREFDTSVEVPCSAKLLWSLRQHRSFDDFLAEHEKQQFFLCHEKRWKDGAGEEMMERKIKLEFRENPVPRAMRSLLKNPDLAIHTSESWFLNKWDEKHPKEYSVEPPALSDRITISGKQWAVPLTEHSCRFVCKDVVSVSRMPGAPVRAAAVRVCTRRMCSRVVAACVRCCR